MTKNELRALVGIRGQVQEDLDDYFGTLGGLIQKLTELQDRMGPNSMIWFDAGYNNVQARVLAQEFLPLTMALARPEDGKARS